MIEILDTVWKFVVFFSIAYGTLWVAGYGWARGKAAGSPRKKIGPTFAIVRVKRAGHNPEKYHLLPGDEFEVSTEPRRLL